MGKWDDGYEAGFLDGVEDCLNDEVSEDVIDEALNGDEVDFELPEDEEDEDDEDCWECDEDDDEDDDC